MLHNTVQCTVKISLWTLARRFYVSRKSWTRGDEGGHLQGGVHWYRFCCMLAERVGQEEMSGVTCRVVCTGLGFAVC